MGTDPGGGAQVPGGKSCRRGGGGVTVQAELQSPASGWITCSQQARLDGSFGGAVPRWKQDGKQDELDEQPAQRGRNARFLVGDQDDSDEEEEEEGGEGSPKKAYFSDT